MSEHRSVWLATADRPEYPALDGDVEVDVAVVGGGITGLTTAVLLQRDGARVALVDAGRLGDGTTGGTTGKVTSQHTLVYADLLTKHGPERARMYAEANQAGVETVAELVADAGADCQFERAPAYVWTNRVGERSGIEAEYEAAASLGLPASLTQEIDLPFPVEVALRFDEQAHFHPVRYLTALARAFTERGGQVFEHTRAQGLDEDDDTAMVHTSGGRIRADQVVVATLIPVFDRGGFFAKERPSRAYGVAAVLDGSVPTGMHISAGSPTHSTRPWHDGDRRGLIVVGGNHETGHGDATPGRFGELEQWAREHFDVASFEYRWSAQDYSTVDEIPYVGRSPRTQRTFVATGFRKWGLSNGTAAARMIADLVAGRDNPWVPAFDATRIGDTGTVAKLVKENVHVGKMFVKDRLARRHAESVDHLARGEGGIVTIDGETVGAYRHPDGTLEVVSITCTHMGCR